MEVTEGKRGSWLDRPLLSKFVLNAETLLFILIVLVAVVSRFYLLEPRVMSHDENTHVYYSWRFAKGHGLAHDPLMHGPFQFHLIALSYFMFGDNDFTARIPSVLFSIATVAFVWFYRRYLGKAGALIAGVLFTISPYMLFYGRYVRNEAFAAFFGVVMLWAILRYLETGKATYTYILTAVTVLHFTAKETAFIYQAQALLFLAFLFFQRIYKASWREPALRKSFWMALLAAFILLAGFGATYLLQGEQLAPNPDATLAPSVPGEAVGAVTSAVPTGLQLGLAAISLLAFAVAGFFLLRGMTWKVIRRERSFSLLILLGTFVLPMLAPFPVRFVGWLVPVNATQVMNLSSTDIWHIAVFLVPLFLLSVVIGIIWNAREWWINAAIFYGLFTIFYTSLFTHGAGFFTGLVGSLGYWLEQQGVNRGSQPGYYYWLIQVPVYEYLPALGTILAGFVVLLRSLGGITKRNVRGSVGEPASEILVSENQADEASVVEPLVLENRVDEMLPVEQFAGESQEDESSPAELLAYENQDSLEEAGFETSEPAIWEADAEQQQEAPAIALFLFWAVTSIIAYSVAGEKMPWLTVHIALPLILCASWFFGRLVDGMDWADFKHARGWLAAGLLPVFVLSLTGLAGALLGAQPPFQGQTLDQLQATSTFITSLLAMIASAAGLFYLLKNWQPGQMWRFFALGFFSLLAFLTARTAFTASYINYDNANELLVYAHSAPGVKTAMDQIEELSIRTTDGLNIVVAYDNDTSYPYWWYLRNYPNQRFYGGDPTKSLRDAPVILVGNNNIAKIEPVVANMYHKFDYIRLWWPNQDYFGLTWERVWNALRDAKMRAALYEIWLNRDYTLYGQVTGKDMSLKNWSPADTMRLYIRKDVIEQLWNYGVSPSVEALQPDPFEGKHKQLLAEAVIGSTGSELGQFQHPRDLEMAADGTLYVADSDNHRIQHLTTNGEVLHTWGGFGDANAGGTEGGLFNQPWGLGLGPDGAVYVADTWNHRIQKFSAEGEFLTMWGYFGQGEQPSAFWGPRDVAVSPDGRVFVTDTGNKRVVVFDSEGAFITQFGSAGMGPGQFDEPVGLALSEDGRKVYVADTWNQRVQVFELILDGTYEPIAAWDLTAWYGQSLDNKPYLDVDDQGRIYMADPEGYRILVLSADGQGLYAFGDFGTELDTFGLPASITLDGAGGAWVSDAGNNRLMYFRLPEE